MVLTSGAVVALLLVSPLPWAMSLPWGQIGAAPHSVLAGGSPLATGVSKLFVPGTAPAGPPTAVSAHLSDGSSNPQWVNISGGLASAPSARSNASVVWDPGDGYVLLFGGEAPNGSALGDTWAFTDGVWTLEHPVGAPQARFGAAMAYDALDGYVVLFGGANSTGPINGTWTYSHGQWSRIVGSPWPRLFPGMVFDPAIPGVVMVGGIPASNVTSNPTRLTWLFRDGAWLQLQQPSALGSGSSGIVAGAMAWDNASDQLLFFQGVEPRMSPVVFSNETWEFLWNASHTNSSRWVLLVTPIAPSPRFDPAMAYDASDRAVLLYGGESSNGTSLADTWLWNGTAWSSYVGSTYSPGPVIGAAASSLATPGGLLQPSGVLVFGGASSPTVDRNDTWLFGTLPLSILPPKPPSLWVDVGIPVHASVVAFGGAAGPYSYVWSGLPPGCPSVNQSALTCVPTGAVTSNVSVAVSDTAGDMAQSGSSVWRVASEPSVTSVSFVPTPVVVGQELTVTAVVSGGVPPFRFNFTGLPPGCSSENQSSLSCVPTVAASFLVNVHVWDAYNLTSNLSALLVVQTHSSPTPSLPAYLIVAFLVGFAAVVALLVIWVFGRRRHPPPPSEPVPDPSPPGASPPVGPDQAP